MKIEKTISPIVSMDLETTPHQVPPLITDAWALQILNENGMSVTVKQAVAIKDFLYRLAKMTTNDDNS